MRIRNSRCIAAVEAALDTQAEDGMPLHNFYSVDVVNPADLPQAAKLNVLFSCYSNPVNNGAEIEHDYGEKVAQTYISPVKTMVSLGMHPAYEQESSDVWRGLSLFMTRKDRNGKVWGPQERIDHATALKMTTIWAAEYVLKPDKLGSIEKGKLADLVVLDKDYMTIPDEEVATIQPQLTSTARSFSCTQSSPRNTICIRPAP